MVENLSALLFHRRYIHPSQHHGARTRQPTITYEPTCARCTKSQFLWLHERKERRKAKSLYYTICVNLASSINSSSLQGDFKSVVFYIIRTNDNVTTSGDINLTPVTLVFSYTPCPAAWPYWHPAVVKITTDHPGPFSWCVTTGPQHAGGIITTGCRRLLTSGRAEGEVGTRRRRDWNICWPHCTVRTQAMTQTDHHVRMTTAVSADMRQRMRTNTGVTDYVTFWSVIIIALLRW